MKLSGREFSLGSYKIYTHFWVRHVYDEGKVRYLPYFASHTAGQSKTAEERETTMAPHIGIGLMSGTSVDAVDAALVEIDASRSQPVRLLNYLEVPIPLPLQQRLRDVMRPDARTTSAS